MSVTYLELAAIAAGYTTTLTATTCIIHFTLFDFTIGRDAAEQITNNQVDKLLNIAATKTKYI